LRRILQSAGKSVRNPMAENWTISVDNRVYGPYTAQQMHAFQAEGRLAAHSLVARLGEEHFKRAGEVPELASLFAPTPAPAPMVAAEPAQEPEAAEPHSFGRSETEADAPSHFVIIADMKSRSIAGLEEEIFNLGAACRFMPQAWILSSNISVSTVRQALVQKLGKLDTLFIADTAHDKAAWFNFGPETDTKVRRMWQRAADPAAPHSEQRASRRLA
jgi:hypothetical protein